MEKQIQWNAPMLKRFKKEYNKSSQKESFIFEGNEFLTSYAKYLIEYLQTKLKN